MMFKNSVKLLAANFSTVWKILVYILIASALGFLLLLPIGNTLIATANTYGLTNELSNFFGNFFIGNTFGTMFSDFFSIVNTSLVCIKFLFVSHTFVGVYLAFLLIVLWPFLFLLSELPVGEGLYGYMSSLARYSYTSSFIRNLGKSCLYALAKLLIVLPFNIVCIVCLYYSLSLSQMTASLQLFAPFLFSVLCCLFITLKTTVLSGWMPAIVVCGYGPFKSLKKGFKAISRVFWKMFSTVLVGVFTAYIINLIIGLFGLIITIPIGSVFMMIFSVVMFFTSQGMRFYVDNDNIIVPKKLEEVDKFAKVKELV